MLHSTRSLFFFLLVACAVVQCAPVGTGNQQPPTGPSRRDFQPPHWSVRRRSFSRPVKRMGGGTVEPAGNGQSSKVADDQKKLYYETKKMCGTGDIHSQCAQQFRDQGK